MDSRVQNTIYKKLFSENNIELASHKVDLANVKDLDKKLTQIFNEQRKLDKINPALEKLIKDQQSSKNMMQIHIKEGESILSDFEKQAKELGVDAAGVSQYKSLKIEVSNSKEYLK